MEPAAGYTSQHLRNICVGACSILNERVEDDAEEKVFLAPQPFVFFQSIHKLEKKSLSALTGCLLQIRAVLMAARSEKGKERKMNSRNVVDNKLDLARRCAAPH